MPACEAAELLPALARRALTSQAVIPESLAGRGVFVARAPGVLAGSPAAALVFATLDPRVQFELTRYLSDNWVPVIEKDVDGPSSLPLQLDGEVPNLGKLSACRRVAPIC